MVNLFYNTVEKEFRSNNYFFMQEAMTGYNVILFQNLKKYLVFDDEECIAFDNMINKKCSLNSLSLSKKKSVAGFLDNYYWLIIKTI